MRVIQSSDVSCELSNRWGIPMKHQNQILNRFFNYFMRRNPLTFYRKKYYLLLGVLLENLSSTTPSIEEKINPSMWKLVFHKTFLNFSLQFSGHRYRSNRILYNSTTYTKNSNTTFYFRSHITYCNSLTSLFTTPCPFTSLLPYMLVRC